MLPQSDPVARYRRYRETAMKLNTALMKYLPKDALEEGARDLGFLHKGVFVFDSEDESSVLMEYCIYNVLRQGRNAVQSLLAQNPPVEGSAEALVLHGMSRAWFSVFVVEAVESGAGVRVLDMLQQTQHLLMDVNFGRSASRGTVLATRVIPMDGFIMSTGAALPVGESTASADKLIGGLHKGLFANNITSFSNMTPQQEKELARTIIRSALSKGASSRIRYEDAGYRGPATPRDHFQREGAVHVPAGGVGRKEPCPCGSGMNYKNCCGK